MLWQRYWALVISVLAVMLAATGCGTTQHEFGTFSSDRFHHGEGLYSVTRLGRDGGFMLGALWRPSNFTSHRVGARPNDSANIEAIDIDRDKDGDADYTLEVPSYDLRLVNDQDDGVVWLRSVPIGPAERSRKLEVLIDRVLANSSGSVGVHILGGAIGLSTVRRFGTRTLEREPFEISGVSGQRVLLEVLDLDAKDAAASSVSHHDEGILARLELVVARLPLRWPQRLDPSKIRPYKEKEIEFLFVAGYRNAPDLFNQTHKHFRNLLARVNFAQP